MTDNEFLEYLKAHPKLWDVVMAVLLHQEENISSNSLSIT